MVDRRWPLLIVALILITVGILLLVAFGVAPKLKKNKEATTGSSCNSLGITGPKGPSGADGSRTGTGATGAPGISGSVTNTGPIGPRGAPGDDGTSNNTGPGGLPGVAGGIGPTGPAGARGPSGGTGVTGATGSRNQTGPMGPPSFALAPVGSSPNADGATIFAGLFQLQPASATFGGVVSNVAQSIVGTKTFDAIISPNVVVQKEFYVIMREGTAGGQSIPPDVLTPIQYSAAPLFSSNWPIASFPVTSFVAPIDGYYEITVSVSFSVQASSTSDHELYILDEGGFPIGSANNGAGAGAFHPALLSVTATTFFTALSTFSTQVQWIGSPPPALISQTGDSVNSNGTTTLSARFLYPA